MRLNFISFHFIYFRNFGLLSFGEEAEEDEVETNEFVQKNAGKAKSLHDVVDDPKLSKEPIKVKEENQEESEPEDGHVAIKEEKLDDDEIAERKQRIKDKLNSKSSTRSNSKTSLKPIKIENSDSEEDLLLTHEEEKKQQSDKKK